MLRSHSIINNNDPIIQAYEAFHSVPYEKLIDDYLQGKDQQVGNLLVRLAGSAKEERSKFAEHVYQLYGDQSLSARGLVILGLAHDHYNRVAKHYDYPVKMKELEYEAAKIKCLVEAADKENNDALYILGMTSRTYDNPSLANGYFQQAAKKGNIFAQSTLAATCVKRSTLLVNPPLVNKTALIKLSQNAEQGCVISLHTLAEFYFKGEHVDKNIGKSQCYAEKAIKMGLSRGLRLLGDIHQEINNREKAFLYFIENVKQAEKCDDPENIQCAHLKLTSFCLHETDINPNMASFYFRYIIESDLVSLKEFAQGSLQTLYQSHPNHLIICYHAAFGLSTLSSEERQPIYDKLSQLLVSGHNDLHTLMQQEPLSFADIHFRQQLAGKMEIAFHCMEHTVLPTEIIRHILTFIYGEALTDAMSNGYLLNKEREDERNAYLKLSTLEKQLDLPSTTSKSVISPSIAQTLWGDNKKRKISLEQKREAARLNIKSAHEGDISYTEVQPRYAKKMRNSLN